MKSDYRWLERWSNSLNDQVVLELGCGDGIDTKTIVKISKSVVACDLEPPQSIAGASKVMVLDHSEKLPFENESFNVVVASLCLHYFSWPDTRNIVTEISRVLNKGGLLLCRLNSENDTNYGATGHPEIEKGMYNVHGRSKRFFSKPDIRNLFLKPWLLTGLEQKYIDRYEKEKVVWEFGAINA
jgi:SAM-dependent methyltransferase